MEGNHDQNK